MKEKVSMRQIAEALDLSLGTVSLVLNGRGDEMRISAGTQKRIWETARRMNYPVRKRRKEGKKIIALFMSVYDGIQAPSSPVISGAMREIREKEYGVDLLVCPFRYDYLKDMHDCLSSDFCSGAVIFALSEIDMEELEKKQFDIPIVLYNRASGKFASVYVDNYSAGMQAASVFARKGFSRVGLVSSENPNKSCALRVQGFADGCRQFGMQLAQEHRTECLLSIDGGRRAAESLAGCETLPEGLFVTNDEMALGILQVFHKKQIRIPDKMSLLSYGGNVWNDVVMPSLSCIRQPIGEMSAACVSLLYTMMETGEWLPVSRILPQEMEYRESCTEPEGRKKKEEGEAKWHSI